MSFARHTTKYLFDLHKSKLKVLYVSYVRLHSPTLSFEQMILSETCEKYAKIKLGVGTGPVSAMRKYF